MQRRLAPFWAGLWLGVIWGLWYVPAFFLSGTPQSKWSLPGFNGPAWPDAQPWDSVVFAALAAMIVVMHRRHYFDKTAGAIEVLAPLAKADSSRADRA